MKKLVLTIPTLYGDHHTTAVRGILEAINGVSEIYVSSAFHQVELQYDAKKVKEDKIKKALSEQGYEASSEGLVFASTPTGIGDRSTRHTAAHAGVGDTLSFAANPIIWEGRPLWPCPGFDPRPKSE
ncbi:MAG: hypothetical protein GTO14_13345 [Anaerolineales bacterium]|nr:hypothetical protein [Anaerolineales bacterium]